MPGSPDVQKIEIKKVVTRNDFALWCNMNSNEFWGFDEQKHFHLITEGKMICMLAFTGGECVATSQILNDGGAAAFEFGYALPEYRQKGIDIALYQYTIRHAFESGVRFVLGWAHPAFTPLTYNIFKSLGFKAVASVD